MYELFVYFTHGLDKDKESSKKFNKERYLFKGDSCFPLSPCSDDKNEKESNNGTGNINIIKKKD